VLIPLWQLQFYHQRAQLPPQPQALGMYGSPDHWRYVYFFHNLGLFAISPDAVRTPLAPGTEGARDALAKQGQYLQSLVSYDNLAVFAYLPDVWLRGDDLHPSLVPGAAL